MLKRPFLVLEGALLAARAIGAREVVWYASQDVLSSVRAAIAVAQQQVPSNVLGGVRWVVVPAANAYVAGEETAAIQAVNGKVAKPSVKPPLPFERGVHGLPTLIQNVETLAHVPFIMRAGATAFRAAGLESSPGTMLVTLSGEVRRPGVYEAPTGARLNDIIEEFGGGVRDGSPLQAVLPGGYFSGWLSGAAVAGGVTLDRQTLQQHGAAIGSGAIAVVSGATCGLAQAVAVLKFFARESARQCGPCTFGTQAMADALQRVASGTPNETDLPKLRQWSEVMLPRRGACGHLDGASMAARTALHVFDKEIRQHARFGRCGRAARVVLEGLGSAGDHRAA
jgi:NADH:ubiquinone oxidoreductase subunit F (NADH-binding)